jgi:hypothetical protein
MIFDLALGGSATLDLGHRTLDKKQRVPSRLSPSPVRFGWESGCVSFQELSG